LADTRENVEPLDRPVGVGDRRSAAPQASEIFVGDYAQIRCATIQGWVS